MSRTLIVGLPGAGKSTLVKLLFASVVSLDHIRHEVSDGTPAGDYLARSIFLRACQERTDAVFEFNGAGGHRHSVRLALSLKSEPLRTIYLRVPVDVARARAASRGTTVPVPDYGVDPAAAFPSMHEVLERDYADHFWAWRPNWTVVVLDGVQPAAAVLAELGGA